MVHVEPDPANKVGIQRFSILEWTHYWKRLVYMYMFQPHRLDRGFHHPGTPYTRIYKRIRCFGRNHNWFSTYLIYPLDMLYTRMRRDGHYKIPQGMFYTFSLNFANRSFEMYLIGMGRMNYW